MCEFGGFLVAANRRAPGKTAGVIVDYEQRCQFDQRRDADDIPTVRIIALR